MKIIDLKLVFGFSFFSFFGFSSPHSPRREFVFVFMIYILCTKKKKRRREMGTGHSILFFFFGWATIWATDWAQIWQGLTRPTRPTGPNGGGFGPREKNSVSKRVGFGPWAKTRGSGLGMEKLGPNPTRCHS